MSDSTPSPLNPSPRVSSEPMMRWFSYGHLPEHLQKVSRRFYELAATLCEELEPSPERTVALRRILEAKDAACRAALW